jgi:uncharacterized membrane protein YgcG
MNYKFNLYALAVVLVSTVASWTGVFSDGSSSASGSSWSSRTGSGGGSYGGGSSGGSHK